MLNLFCLTERKTVLKILDNKDKIQNYTLEIHRMKKVTQTPVSKAVHERVEPVFVAWRQQVNTPAIACYPTGTLPSHPSMGWGVDNTRAIPSSQAPPGRMGISPATRHLSPSFPSAPGRDNLCKVACLPLYMGSRIARDRSPYLGPIFHLLPLTTKLPGSLGTQTSPQH